MTPTVTYTKKKIIGGTCPKLSKNAVISGNHRLVSEVTSPFFSFFNVVLYSYTLHKSYV